MHHVDKPNCEAYNNDDFSKRKLHKHVKYFDFVKILHPSIEQITSLFAHSHKIPVQRKFIHPSMNSLDLKLQNDK